MFFSERQNDAVSAILIFFISQLIDRADRKLFKRIQLSVIVVLNSVLPSSRAFLIPGIHLDPSVLIVPIKHRFVQEYLHKSMFVSVCLVLSFVIVVLSFFLLIVFFLLVVFCFSSSLLVLKVRMPHLFIEGYT